MDWKGIGVIELDQLSTRINSKTMASLEESGLYHNEAGACLCECVTDWHVFFVIVGRAVFCLMYFFSFHQFLIEALSIILKKYDPN